jgi:hypothetical protein
LALGEISLAPGGIRLSLPLEPVCFQLVVAQVFRDLGRRS